MFGESGWAMIVLAPTTVTILMEDGWGGTTVVGDGGSWFSVGGCDIVAMVAIAGGGGGGFWFSVEGCNVLAVGEGGGSATGEGKLVVVIEVGVTIGDWIVGAAAAGSVEDVGTGWEAEGRRPPVIGGTAPADKAERLDSLPNLIWRLGTVLLTRVK
jgi:hypothetical protein